MDVLLNTTNDTSDVDDSFTYLSTTSQIIHCILLFIYFLFGIVGNTLNIFLFIRSALSRTSSSVYLLCGSIGDLSVTIFIIPFRIFADGFNLDLTSYSLLSCRLVSYLYYVALTVPRFCIILANADRWAASCVQANRRKFASIYVARRLVPVIIVVCCLLYSHIFVTFTTDYTPPPPFCSVNDYYSVPILLLQLITYSIVPPFFMAFFSIGIILNSMQRRHRTAPTTIQLVTILPMNTMIRRKRRPLNQMQVMLICQAMIDCVLTLPFSLINLVSLLVDNDNSFLTLYSFVRLIIFINYVSSFYIYTSSSKLYRDEFKKLIKRLFNRQ
ncbi:unnamed protein product [Adineta steineri]|uniref:G-protein coupled receptors family 1 profile domain-containing protein n=1 Tax=Adineta steineri TaxID=433720 RepID=A0A819D761_9BILA|nr:unnamed protein product [Adineta steineri]CAF1184078.1 unnamed protein product [Adineta steineri]CAF1421819.1 unnamed protein product [Adineta steineri]CAF3833412.1 unnamed protein product [Adineta steineri]